ncbi:MAG TPA: beta-ketoacyl synthase N-terminal-like domain-containing protein [Cytophaga sp.]|nr:beta-ketoacyl synthase N-terminal-like domain-containing protein [Cytophaga sp.]
MESYNMKSAVYILSDSVVTPLGKSIDENMDKLYAKISAIQAYAHDQMGTVYRSKFSDTNTFQTKNNSAVYTKIERLFIYSIEQALSKLPAVDQTNVLFVFASTKGNIEHLTDAGFDLSRLRIGVMANQITAYFNNPNQPIVVSNACISGLQAIQYACQILQHKKYSHVIVTGADCVSDFVLSGFYSFQALSPFPCTPFDKDRAGVSLGEGCGTLVLSATPQSTANIEIAAAVSSNDANHLSGPSRTGEGLASAINGAIREAGIQPTDIDIVSAHGTATLYNDEMEGLAFQTTGVSAAPVYSVKGNIGHTLGAAGIIETIYLAHSMQDDKLIPSIGFSEIGTSVALNVVTEAAPKKMSIGLKTASGFGGGNTAIILKKQK